jgi:hypothetical protein
MSGFVIGMLLKKQNEEVEYAPLKVMNQFIVSYNSICLMCGCRWHISPPLLLSYSEKENRQAQGRNRKSK